jgi:hypothetical protein
MYDWHICKTSNLKGFLRVWVSGCEGEGRWGVMFITLTHPQSEEVRKNLKISSSAIRFYMNNEMIIIFDLRLTRSNPFRGLLVLYWVLFILQYSKDTNKIQMEQKLMEHSLYIWNNYFKKTHSRSDALSCIKMNIFATCNLSKYTTFIDER